MANYVQVLLPVSYYLTSLSSDSKFARQMALILGHCRSLVHHGHLCCVLHLSQSLYSGRNAVSAVQNTDLKNIMKECWPNIPDSIGTIDDM